MSRYPQPPPGYFELPTTAAIEEHIARIDDALRYACGVRDRALRAVRTIEEHIARIDDALLRTRAALRLELSVLGEGEAWPPRV